MGSITSLFHCILLPKASQGAGKRLPVLVGGAVKTTDTRNGRNWGRFFNQFERDQCLILSWPRALKHFLGKSSHVSFLVGLWAPAQSAKGCEDEVKVGHGRWLCCHCAISSLSACGIPESQLWKEYQRLPSPSPDLYSTKRLTGLHNQQTACFLLGSSLYGKRPLSSETALPTGNLWWPNPDSMEVGFGGTGSATH